MELNRAWIADNRWLLTIGTITTIGVLLVGLYKYFCEDATDLHVHSKIALILLAFLVGWFLDIFTGDADKRKVHQMVAFCYVFPFALFAAALTPLLAYPNLAFPEPPKPVGIILGCSDSPILPQDKNLVPAGIACDNRTTQWLVNIGGHATPLDERKTAEAEAKTEAAALALAQVRSEAGGQGNVKDKAKSEAIVKADDKPKDSKDTKFGSNDLAKSHKYNDQFRITGGLVVPLYFVILSICGGFVSMLRRVPEYQERVSQGASDPLSFERAREKLVFEALQLLAAPLIAITAYYLVDPESRASSIALGFIAGFSSETVLLYVRALSEKLQPETTRKVPDIEVLPSSANFATQAIGTTSAPQTVSLKNRSKNAVNGTVTVSGEFACTPVGPFTLAAGGNITFAVTFSPVTAGNKIGELQIQDSAPGSPRVIHLSGDA